MNINQPNGLAGLDSNGNITSNINTSNIIVSSTNNQTYPTIYIGQDPTIFLGSPLVGDQRVQIGGTPLQDVPGSPLKSWAGLPQRLLIGGNTDGPYNNGCSLCVFTRPTFQNTQLAELGGDNYLENGKIPTGFDMAGIYWEAGEIPARLVLEVSSYTSNTAILTRKLTNDEMLLIHQGQYIVTNSLLDGAKLEENVTDKTQFIAGIVKSVDNTGNNAIITVYSWNTQGSSGNSIIPSLTNFDTFYFPNITKPTVFVGAGTKMFAFNTMMQYDGNETGSGTNSPTSVIHSLEWGEIDINVQNETREHMLSFHGLTFGGSQTVPTGSNISSRDVFTPESYEILLAQDLPHHLIITEACGNMAIESTGFYLPGRCNLYTSVPDSNGKQAEEITEFSGITANTNTGANYEFRIPMYIESDDGDYDYTHADFHINPRINGNRGQILDDQSSPLGDLIFNGTGGFKLCASGDLDKCGLIINSNGSANMLDIITSSITTSGQVSTSQIALSGNMYYQDSNKNNQIVVYTGTKSITYDGLGNPTDGNIVFNISGSFNSNLKIPYGTPTKGSSCTNGQIMADDTNNYTCRNSLWTYLPTGSNW